MSEKIYPKKNYSPFLEPLNKQSNKNNQKGEEPQDCLPSFLINSLDNLENEDNNNFDEEEQDFSSTEHTDQNSIDKNDSQKNIKSQTTFNKNFCDNKNECNKKNNKNKFNLFSKSNNSFDESNEFNLNYNNYGNNTINFNNQVYNNNFIITKNLNINNHIQNQNFLQMFLNFQLMQQQMQNLSINNFNPMINQLFLLNIFQNQNEKNNNDENGKDANLNSKKKKNKKQNNTKNQIEIKENDISISMNNLLLLSDNEFYSLIITQKGSREVQQLIKKSSEKEIDNIISKLTFQFSDIMIDKYGNYFSQKLIQICNEKQRVKLLSFIEKRFVEISNNSFGTHPLQSFIEIISSNEEKQLVLKYIKNKVCELSLDSKGTHVLQKFISRTNDNERNELNDSIIKNIQMLIDDPFGVCVLIKLIKHTNDKSIKEKIVNFICEGDILSFITHPYANYVVQSFFNPTDINLCDKIIGVIVQNYYELSMKKFSSNVVENCLKYGDEKNVKKIFKDVIEKDKLENLLNNTYGNFVIEKLISRLNKEEKNQIINKIGNERNLSNTIMNLLYK